MAGDNNRIGDLCWYEPLGSKDYRRGTLRMWGTDTEEYGEHGPGMFPVAVIEDLVTCSMVSIHVHFVTFAELPPSRLATALSNQ